jgi:hypothetical protein
LKFVDGTRAYQILVLNHEGLVTAAVLLVQFHHEALVIGDGELRHREDRALALFARHEGGVVLRAERQNNLLLHGSTLRNLLVHDFPSDVVHKVCATDFSFGCTSFRLSINRRMMNKDLSYCIVLSSEQLSYLAGSKYGIDRMKILNRLIEATVLEQTEYSKKGFATTLQVGQAALSEVELSCKLGYDKKTISRVIDKMNRLGIVASVQSNRTSIHTLKCVSAWMLDGKRIDNPFYVRMKDRKDGNQETANRPYNNDSILPMNRQHILESQTETNCPPQTQTDSTTVSDETYFPDLSASPIIEDIPVIADDGELLMASSSVCEQPLPFLIGDKNEAEDSNSNDGLNAETDSHEFPSSPTTTSGDEIAEDGNARDTVQIDSASIYPTTVWASPQPLAEEESANT